MQRNQKITYAICIGLCAGYLNLSDRFFFKTCQICQYQCFITHAGTLHCKHIAGSLSRWLSHCYEYFLNDYLSLLFNTLHVDLKCMYSIVMDQHQTARLTVIKQPLPPLYHNLLEVVSRFSMVITGHTPNDQNRYQPIYMSFCILIRIPSGQFARMEPIFLQ